MKSTQEILNAIRLDESGNPIAVLESSQQALNAVYVPGSNAIRVKNTGGVIVGGDGSKLGIWSSSEDYSVNDLTTKDGNIYVALIASTSASPKDPTLNPDYWMPYNETINQTISLGNRLYLDDSDSDITDYHVLSESPTGGTEQTDSVIVNNNSLLIEAYATPAGGLGVTSIPSDLWVFDVWCSVSSTVGTTEILIDVYKRTSGGVETLLFSVTTGDINSTVASLVRITSVQDAFAVNADDRLVVEFTGQTDRVVDTTVTLYHNGTEHYSLIETPSLLTHNSIPEKQGGQAGEYYHLTSAQHSGLHTHSNKTELDLVSDGDHDVRTDNPHAVNATQISDFDTEVSNNTDVSDNTAARHTHSNKTELDLITDGDHDVRTDNPHATDIGNLGSGTLSELNTVLSDATLIDTGDSRLSDARTPTSHASAHTNGTDDIQSATASQKGLMTTAYAGKIDGIEAGAISAWHSITDFTATPASTSTLTMTSDLTGTLNPGSGLKYTIGGTVYYGMITALTDSLMTVCGAPLSGDVTSLHWTHIKPIVLEFGITGEFADAADTALLENDLLLKGGYKWMGCKARLVNLAISTFQNDSGASTQPAVNVSIAGSDVLSTALTIPDGTYTQSGVQVATANYDVNYGEAIELSVSAASGGTPGNNALDLFAILTFIPELV